MLDDLLRDWAHGHPDRDSEVRVVGHRWSERTVRGEDVPRPQPRALPLARGRARPRRRPGCSSSPARASTTCPSWRCPTAPRSAPPPPSSSPTRSACAPAPRSRSTTCASSAAARPGSPQRCTPPPRGCRPSWSSATPRADRPGRARRSRTTSASPRASPAPTSPTERWRRRRGSARRWCWRATSSASRPAVRCARCCSSGSADIEARAVLVATGVSYRRLEAPGLDEVVGRGRLLRRQRERGDARRPARTCTSSARRTRPGRRRSTSPATPSGSCSSSAAPRSRCRCRSTSSAGSSPRPTSRSGCSTEVVGARGDGHLEAITLCDRDGGKVEEVETSWVFVFIGAAPRTDWLGDAVARDGHGFVLTGPDLPADRLGGRWTADRSPWRRACPASSPPATYA